MKAKLKAIWRILCAKEWVYLTRNKDDDGYVSDVCINGYMPKETPAHVYVDLMFTHVRRLTAGMRIIADKIENSYHNAGIHQG